MLQGITAAQSDSPGQEHGEGPRKHVSSLSLSIERRRVKAVRKAIKKLKPGEDSFIAEHIHASAEVRFQKARLAGKSYEASKQGLLLPDDLQCSKVKSSLKLARSMLAKQKKVKKATKTKLIPAPPRPGSAPLAKGPLRGACLRRAGAKVQHIFIDNITQGVQRQHIKSQFPDSTFVENILEADLILTATSEQASTRAQMVLRLLGCTLMDDTCFQGPSDGKKPLQVRFAPAVGVRRL